MPIEEIVGFGIRFGAEVAVDVVQAVGSGDTRAAAGIRLAIFAMGSAACVVAISRLVARVAADDARMVSIGLLVLAAGGGAYLLWRSADEWRRLRHWGEPTLLASADRLTIVKTGETIAWAAIESISVERRKASGVVRIKLAGGRKKYVRLVSRQPEALSAALLAHPALERLRQ